MSPRRAKLPISISGRNVALCYVRQSYTRDATDTNSPERQHANIKALCVQRGWIPQFFTDADGHKSAFYEQNRPAWLELKDRINDSDVVAVVANDPNRLHRKMWRMGSLLESVERNSLHLVFASPTSPIRDISNPADKFILQMYALMDENTVLDISRKQKDSIAYRKGLGKSVGVPPFGSVRNSEGYLTPSPFGAWVLPDGRSATGHQDDDPPAPEADWRGYYDCALRILTLYATGGIGRDKIARQMNNDHWRFKDRNGKPRRIEDDDVRRVTSNWGEYGGIVTEKAAKDRPGYAINLDEILFVSEHAIFPIELLRRVAEVSQIRTIEQVDHGVNRQTYPYPLEGHRLLLSL